MDERLTNNEQVKIELLIAANVFFIKNIAVLFAGKEYENVLLAGKRCTNVLLAGEKCTNVLLAGDVSLQRKSESSCWDPPRHRQGITVLSQ